MEIRLRMSRGSGWLDQWEASAGQVEKNAVHQALFAIMDGSVFTRYEVLDDANRGREFFIVVREDLVIKASVNWYDAFAVLYIGPPDAAPGWQLAIARREQQSRLGFPSGRPPEVDPDQPSFDA
jgi:hypothetical protein